MYLQIMLSLALSLTFACYLFHVRPHRDNYLNNAEVFNEVCFLTIHYSLFLMTDFTGTNTQKYKTEVGWYIIWVSTVSFIMPNFINILWHIVVETKNLLVDMYRYIAHCQKNRGKGARNRSLKNLEIQR